MGTKATRAANVNGNQWYQNWGRPTNVTEEERAKVVEEFSKKRVGEKNTISVTWKNFWVQQVYKGETTYTDGFGQNIGLVGETGQAFGAHLHFQVEVDGVAVNPLNYI